jgi:hypothetical protein
LPLFLKIAIPPNRSAGGRLPVVDTAYQWIVNTKVKVLPLPIE